MKKICVFAPLLNEISEFCSSGLCPCFESKYTLTTYYRILTLN
jgi:hypothetical protein